MVGACAGVLLAGGAAAAAAQREKAEQALASLKATPEAAAVAKEPMAKAQKALDRGNDARKTGDTLHADQLDALALEWAGTSVDLARTAKLEADAEKLEAETADLEARAKRALSLIEQTVARRGRAREKLQELGVDVARTPEANTQPAPKAPEKPAAPQPAPAKPAAPAPTAPAPAPSVPAPAPQGGAK